MEDQKRGSAAALAEIVKRGGRIPVAEMADLAGVAADAGGKLVAVDVVDDWCGTGTLRFKWPPKKKEFQDFIEVLVERHIHFDVNIYGQPAPDDLFLRISRQRFER